MLDLSDLEALIARLAAADFSQSSEQDAREMAVNPVIGALGWNTFDRGEVFREFSVRGGRVDYCLRRQKRNLVLIEVKRVGTELGEHQEQLLRYAFDEGVPLAALTDGLVWWLYLPMAGGSWEQRRFFCVGFREQEPGDAASAIYRFLNCEDVASGAALEEAQREFESQERDRRIRAALQEAWQRMLEDPHGLLRDLLAETVQELTGHLPDPETISEFLRRLSGSGSMEDTSPGPPLGSNIWRAREHDARSGETEHLFRSESERSMSNKGSATQRKRKATKKMTTNVKGGWLLVKFADDRMKQWELPDRSDKEAFQRIRGEAVTFASVEKATLGQINAIKKALTDAGYYLKGPRGKTSDPRV